MKKLIDPLCEHIASQVLAWAKGEHDAVLDWLRRLGCQVSVSDADTDAKPQAWRIVGLTGLVTALMPSPRPCDTAPIFGFILAGQLWPSAYPGLLEIVNRAARAALKKA